MIENWSTWKKVIYDGCKAFEIWKIICTILKWTFWKLDVNLVLDTFHLEHVCNIYSRVNLSKPGVVSHMRFHDSIWSQTDFTQVVLQQPGGSLCQFCDKVCVFSIWLMPMAKTGLLVVTYVAGLVRVKLVLFTGLRRWLSSVKNWQWLYIYIYIYIYMRKGR